MTRGVHRVRAGGSLSPEGPAACDGRGVQRDQRHRRDGDAGGAGGADREPRAARDRARCSPPARARASSARSTRRTGRRTARRCARRRRPCARPRADRRAEPDLVVTWPYTAPAQVELLRARGIAVFMPIRNDRWHRRRPRAARRARRNRRRRRRSRRSFRARIASAAADRHAGTAQAACVLRDLDRAALHDRRPAPHLGGDRGYAAATTYSRRSRCPRRESASRRCSRRRPRRSSPVPTTASVRLARRWRRWTELPAARAGHSVVVDADLLHRTGPRFVDGVASLCAALDAARRNGRAPRMRGWSEGCERGRRRPGNERTPERAESRSRRQHLVARGRPWRRPRPSAMAWSA